jgi:hypothetical protein
MIYKKLFSLQKTLYRGKQQQNSVFKQNEDFVFFLFLTIGLDIRKRQPKEKSKWKKCRGERSLLKHLDKVVPSLSHKIFM